VRFQGLSQKLAFDKIFHEKVFNKNFVMLNLYGR
jgi:hypothetical protein